MSYRREDTYNNSNYISDGLSNADIYKNAKDFIEVANKELYKSSTQQHSITASLKNLLFMKEFEPIVDSFETGNWIRIKTDGKLYRLRLIEYEIDFENPENIAVTFSDVTKIQGGYSDIESILNQASSMATSYDYVARQSKAGKSAREIVDGWVDRGLALTTQKIINDADNQSITMDSNGLLCKEYDSITDTFNDNQVKIINKGLYITDDNWKTAKAGIGAFTYTDPVSKKVVSSYGVIADTIVGKIILSENVGIYNSGNSVQIDKDGFVITFPSSNIPDNIFKIRKKTTTGGYQNLLYVDSDGDLTLKGKITATNLELDGCKIPYSSVSGTPDLDIYIAEDGTIGTGTFANDDNVNGAFKVSSNGLLQAKNAVIYGTVYASKGEIGGFSIEKNYLKCGTVGSNNGFLLYPGGSSTTYSVAGSDSKSFSMIVGSDFGITPSGKLHASSAEISGNITATNLTLSGCSIKASKVKGANNKTLQDELYGDSTGTKLLFYKAGTAIKQTESDTAPTDESHSNNYFSVSSQGLLTAANAVIYGTVYASKGEIGGFTIDASSLSYDTVGKDYAMLIYPKGEKNSDGYVYRNPTTFAIENNTNNPRANFSLIIGKSFGVSDNGKLYASGAEISGKIHATEGDMGGWKVGTGSQFNPSRSAIYYNFTPSDPNYSGDVQMVEMGIFPGKYKSDKCFYLSEKIKDETKNETYWKTNIALRNNGGIDCLYLTAETRINIGGHMIEKFDDDSLKMSCSLRVEEIKADGGVSIKISEGTTKVVTSNNNDITTWDSVPAIHFYLPDCAAFTAEREVISLYSAGSGTKSDSILRYRDLYNHIALSNKAKKIVYVDEDGRFCVAS